MNGICYKKSMDGNEVKHEGFEFMQKNRLQPRPSECLNSSLSLITRSFPDSIKILLVDDDAVFGKIMQRSALLRGIDLTFCVAIDEVAQYNHEKFDMALIDFNLGSVTGVEFSEYLTRYNFGDLDTIIISHNQQTVSHLWPFNARRFLNKNIGPHMIFDSVFQTYRSKQLSRAGKHSD